VLAIAVADPFTSWIGGFPGLADTTPGGDPDADGVSNLLEYVLQNGDPAVSSTAILPTSKTTATDLVFTFHRRSDSSADTRQTFQYSNDLSAWTDVPITNTSPVAITPNSPSPGIDKVVVTVPKNANARLFGRLKVSKP
jgi:hypothetical protein